MEVKKIFFKIAIFIIAMSTILGITISSNAATETSLYLGLEEYRNSNLAYMTEERIMWKISSYDENGNNPDKTRTIYCIKAGPGFGSSNDMGNGTILKRNYTEPFNLKNYAAIGEVDGGIYQAVLPSNVTDLTNTDTVNYYNSLVWVLEHCYVPAKDASEAEFAAKFRNELLTAAGIENSLITDDEIDIAQQLAIWYFTNSDGYKITDETFSLWVKSLTDGEYKSIGDKFTSDGDERNDDAIKLFMYLVENGRANGIVTPNPSDIANTIEIISTGATILKQGGNYIAGPYKIETNSTEYTLEATLKDSTGTTDLTYTILDSSKNPTTLSLKELELTNSEFYLSIPTTQDVDGAKFTVSMYDYYTKLTYWSVAGANTIEQPVVEIERKENNTSDEMIIQLPEYKFDLALRKFITSVNGKELTEAQTSEYIRKPNIDVTALANDVTVTTADYKHQKDPVGVRIGDIVIYTIRIYNEGEVDGYASNVTTYLPPEIEFVTDDEENFNATYGWIIDSTLRKATTSKLAKSSIDPAENLLKAFDKTTMTEPDYVELKIKCRVKSTAEVGDVITSIAEITGFTDLNGNSIMDLDSSADNITLPTDENLPSYKGNTSNKSILTDKTYHYKGQEDDDDFEKLIIEEFDLALRKFITSVDDLTITNRIPVFTKVKDENGNYIYEHPKTPLEVETADIVEYTIRIYNEGNIAGYAKQIKDNIPSGLQFVTNSATNTMYRWKMLDENGIETTDVNKAKYITTDYLSKEQEKIAKENLLQAYDQQTMSSPDYKDVKVEFKVVAPYNHEGIITNIAEISEDSDINGNDIEDKDSIPNNNNEKEDDIDVEHIKLTYFDLALRKFITAVDNTEITNRYPVFKIDEQGKYVYEHTKEPVEVENGNIVVYTLRIYNEGTKSGYAKEIKDDLPEGLEFLPENTINTEYRWIMIDKNGVQTENVEEAVSITTDYLSKEQQTGTGRDNLLKAFAKDTMEEPNYKDIKIAFKVTEPNTSDRILINKAQISNDSDANGKDVIDRDSTPDKWIDGEDDQDIEKVKVKYFDLALRKWVTQAILIQDGKETVTETGHKAEDNPEQVVKVEIVESKLNKVVVKFRYKIRVTNEGEIAGYVDEISDYIPEGLRFVAGDNPEWKEVDGKVVTDQLKDILLEPGESAEVEILLTWNNGKDNLGLKINTAEISKDRNNSDTPDIDSTPNNEQPGEDDIDDAPVILIIKTGSGINGQYIVLAIGCLSILSSGIIFIKKYVL